MHYVVDPVMYDFFIVKMVYIERYHLNTEPNRLSSCDLTKRSISYYMKRNERKRMSSDKEEWKGKTRCTDPKSI